MTKRKYFFSLGLAAILFLALVGSSSAQGLERHKTGELVSDHGTVYLVKDSSRFGFRTPEEFWSYGYTFSMVLPATAGDLLLPVDGILRARAGTLVRDKSDHKTLYLVYDTGARPLQDPSLVYFLDMQDRKVFDIDVSSYPKGGIIDLKAAFLPSDPGTLVRDQGTVYLVTKAGRAPFPSESIFRSYGYGFDMVFQANTFDLKLPVLAQLSFRDGSLINDQGTVFLISGNKKYGFKTLPGFLSRGYSLNSLIVGDTSGLSVAENFD